MMPAKHEMHCPDDAHLFDGLDAAICAALMEDDPTADAALLKVAGPAWERYAAVMRDHMREHLGRGRITPEVVQAIVASTDAFLAELRRCRLGQEGGAS